MHHIYHTEGIILGSRNFGEAGKYYSVFTRELGLVHASAQGVRKMSSKLRFILQDFAYVKVDLVQGKDFWRITSASKTGKLEGLSENLEVFKVVSNIASLLKRLLAGVEKNVNLFTDVLEGLTALGKVQNSGELRDLEIIIVLRILNNLGYIGGNEALQDLIKSPFAENLIFKISKSRREALQQINKALKESHL